MTAFNDFASLMDAAIDDIDSLPPIGVPPTGNYKLRVTATQVTKAGGNPYIRFEYEVLEVESVSNPDEEKDAAEGMSFSNIYSPFKKDGSPNEFGIGLLKEAVQPYSLIFGTSSMRATLEQIRDVEIYGQVNRWPDKKEPGRWNFAVRNVELA